jgi:integrase
VGIVGSARSYLEAVRSPNTRRAYAADWRGFQAWCEAWRLPSLPAAPETVALYLAHLADRGRKASTIGRALAAISQAYKLADEPSPRAAPAVSEMAKGIWRKLGTAPAQKAPVLSGSLRTMLGRPPESVLGLRDRALLALGFSGAFRRSELVALDVEDLVFSTDGLEVTIRRSKTDQLGEGRKVGIPYGASPATCPVRAMRAWLGEAGIDDGAIFRPVTRHGRVGTGRLSDRAVALVVKRYAGALGLEPKSFAGHSLRAGLATSAAKAGKSERAIMRQTGHRSVQMVRRYIRDAELFSDNAAAGLL